jgi:hypothetical protein
MGDLYKKLRRKLWVKISDGTHAPVSLNLNPGISKQITDTKKQKMGVYGVSDPT